MKTVLIVSPHFPPVNTADMHRVRQCLPFLSEFGWKAVVFTIDPDRIENARDELLLQSLPSNVEVHRVSALPVRLTRKLGLGNLGIRSYLHLRQAVDHYLSEHQIDLIYFSTTVFVSMALGPHWKRKFKVPFVIDLQDPWRNDFHLATPPAERPKKFWFDFRLNQYLEKRTMPYCDGLIAVSRDYIASIKARYPACTNMPSLTLPFGAMTNDFEIAKSLPAMRSVQDITDIVYIGRGGQDMSLALGALFHAFRQGLQQTPEIYKKVRFTFIGTSYAPDGKGIKNVEPLAAIEGVEGYVTEITDRLPYFQSLRRLQEADLLLMPGSSDTGYTASKLYPYILARRPILALFNQNSSVVDILSKTRAGEVVSFNNEDKVETLGARLLPIMTAMLQRMPYETAINWQAFEAYTAREMTRQQCAFFDRINAQQ